MMTLAQEWLMRVIGAALLMAAVSVLTPRGAVRRIALLCCAVIFLLSVLRPLLGGELPKLRSSFSLREELLRQTEEFQRSNFEAWETLIERELLSYIETKAAELHCDCSVSLRLSRDADGIPVPEEVTLTAAEENDALAACISQELGIDRERIRWRIT